MSTNPAQLFLLADHIKLSLLERQRAIALNIEGNKQDGHITRSLETVRDGLENLRKQQRQLSSTGDSTKDLNHQISRLQTQYNDLSAQFFGPSAAIPSQSTITSPNDPSLASDFKHATQPRSNKSVRFRDNPNSYHDDDQDEDDDTENRTALFDGVNNNSSSGNTQPYRDDPSSEDATDHLSNQQIHAYHTRVLRDQDSQLDTLGESVRRQRQLGLQMGEELDEQVEMLGDVEAGVDRHASTLDRANSRLKGVAKKAKDNWSWITITCLILILVLLIALT